MSTHYGAKKVVVADAGMDADDCMDEGEGVVVQYWVGEGPSHDKIGIDTNGQDMIHPSDAKRVAKAIGEVLAWRGTDAGKAEVKRLRAVHRKREKEWQAEQAAKRAGQTGSVTRE